MLVTDIDHMRCPFPLTLPSYENMELTVEELSLDVCIS